MLLAFEKLEALAPDQASLAAAVRIKPNAWSMLALSNNNVFAWGECQGSGSAPYRVCVELADLASKCTCPSRKFPCKHSLSLMVLLAKSPQSFQTGGAAPDWVSDWSRRRRPPKADGEAEESKPRASLEAAFDQASTARSKQAETTAALQRERLRAQREQAILAGLDELDRWIEDCATRGLAGFMADAPRQCRTLAQRMVDARAPGLATWLDTLPSKILALPERSRADAIIDELGSLHLLAEAYRRQDRLPEPLRHDVRRLVGWTQERQALLDDPTALRMKAAWMVIAVHAQVQPDKLRRIETWLMSDAADPHDPPAYAVLIDFVPAATGPAGSAFVPGETFSGELVFYPSAVPLRAILAHRGETPPFAARAVSLNAALDAYDDLRAKQPWLGPWPMTLRGVACHNHGDDGLWLMNGTSGVPLAPRQRDDAYVLAGVSLESITGLWDGRHFTAVMAETSLGRWVRR